MARKNDLSDVFVTEQLLILNRYTRIIEGLIVSIDRIFYTECLLYV